MPGGLYASYASLRMCANYTPPKPAGIKAAFGLDAPASYPDETYPGHFAPIVRLADDDSDKWDCVNASFGMVPAWAELKLSRHTYNARSETVASKPSFRHAYAKRQFCIIPAESFFEPSYESGRAVRWKIARADQSLLGIAGLWEWRPNGGIDDQPLLSFTMLTINADTHPLMKRFHRPEDEKRMLVLLEPAQYQAWLHATPDRIGEFLQPCPAEQLIAEPSPRIARPPARTASRPPKAVPRSATRIAPVTPSLWDED